MGILSDLMTVQSGLTDADHALSDLESQVETAESDLLQAQALQPWVSATAMGLRNPENHPLLPSIASRLRSVAGQNLDQLPGVLGQMSKEMTGRGLDARRLDVVDKFLGIFYKLVGE